MPRININEYSYIDYEIENGMLTTFNPHNIQSKAIDWEEDDNAYFILLPDGLPRKKDKKIIRIDKKDGKYTWLYKVDDEGLITTAELVGNYVSSPFNADDEKSKEILANQAVSLNGLDTKNDLHTHFIQVLSAEQLLDFVREQGVEKIFVGKPPTYDISIINEDDYIGLSEEKIKKKYNCDIVKISDLKDDRIKQEKILAQLAIPNDMNIDFKYFESFFPKRSSLIKLACCSANTEEKERIKIIREIKNLNQEIEALKKEIHNYDKNIELRLAEAYKRKEFFQAQIKDKDKREKKINEVESEIMHLKNMAYHSGYKIGKEAVLQQKKSLVLEKKEALTVGTYKKLLSKNLEVLKEHGVEYVEFSYSNVERIRKVIDNFSDVDGIDYKFLISQHRSKSSGIDFISACKSMCDMISDDKYADKIAGFDLMGFEDKIVEADKLDSREKCNTLYTKLKYAITGMLVGSLNSEVKPTLRLHAGEIDYGEESNPNSTLEILELIENEIKSEYEEIYRVLDAYKNDNLGNIELLKKNHDKYEIYNSLKSQNKLQTLTSLINNIVKKKTIEKKERISQKDKDNIENCEKNIISLKFELGEELLNIFDVDKFLLEIGNAEVNYIVVEKYINNELKKLEKDYKKYKIIDRIKAKNLSRSVLDKELERVKRLKDNFSLKDRLNIRIGHGLHFKDSTEYYQKLRHFGVTVELCPSSNIRLGNMKGLAEIPYYTYLKNGIPVVVGTDGEGYFSDSMMQDASLIAASFDYHSSKFVNGPDRDRGNDSSEKQDKSTDTGILDECLGCFIGNFVNDLKHNNEYSSKAINMDMTVDKYMISLHNSNQQFINDYNNAKGKKKYVNNYFKNMYSINGDRNYREIERLKNEIVKTYNFIMDMQSNELYFNNSELELVKKTYERINEYFESARYVKAAILLVSLQGVTGYQTGLEEVVYLMKENNLEFAKCLKTKEINKYVFDEVDHINKIKVSRDRQFNNKTQHSLNRNCFTKEHKYNVNQRIAAIKKAYTELLDLVERHPETLLNPDIESIIIKIDDYMEEIYNINEAELLNERMLNLIEEKIKVIALGISTVQKCLDIDTDLSEFRKNYDLEYYDDVDSSDNLEYEDKEEVMRR